MFEAQSRFDTFAVDSVETRVTYICENGAHIHVFEAQTRLDTFAVDSVRRVSPTSVRLGHKVTCSKLKAVSIPLLLTR